MTMCPPSNSQVDASDNAFTGSLKNCREPLNTAVENRGRGPSRPCFQAGGDSVVNIHGKVAKQINTFFSIIYMSKTTQYASSGILNTVKPLLID